MGGQERWVPSTVTELGARKGLKGWKELGAGSRVMVLIFRGARKGVKGLNTDCGVEKA